MENEKWSDVNVVSSLLKTFFRKLPDPMITDGQYALFRPLNQCENAILQALFIPMIFKSSTLLLRHFTIHCCFSVNQCGRLVQLW